MISSHHAGTKEGMCSSFTGSGRRTSGIRAGAPGNVAGFLRQRAEEHPDRGAFVEGCSGRTLTWADLQRHVDGWSVAAEALGRDRRIGLLVADPLEMIAAYLAAIATGITVAPLNPSGTVPERVRQAALLGLAAVVTDDVDAPVGALPRWLLGSHGTLIASPTSSGRPTAVAAPAPADGAAVVLASSGTTGEAKIIPLDENQLLHTAFALAEHHGLGPEDRAYSPLPLFHINALVVGVLSTVVIGASLVVDRRFAAATFWETVERHHVTWLNLVPAIIATLAECERPAAATAARVGFARSASAPLPAVIRERFEEVTGVGVLETYGMTEAASQIAANPRDPSLRRPGSVGLPVGLDIRVVDRGGRVVEPGTVGEVQIRGESVVDRYWAPWDPTAASSSRPASSSGDGWLATGDLGSLDDDGFVFLAGRLDDVINRGGEKVFPRDVEEVLLADRDVMAAAVVGRPHPRFGQEPVAFVVARPGVDPDALTARLSQRCERSLSRFRRPAAITVADALPAGPTGKIRHAELRRRLSSAAITAN